MRLQFTLAGVAPIIMHNLAAGLDTRSPVSREIAEIAAKKGGNRTDADDLRLQELECQRSLYLGADGKPTLPAAALRAMIEAGARTVRQGPQVRGGLLIEPEVLFRYDVKRYGGTLEKLVETAQFTAPVVVQGKSILRTRAKFDCPWSVVGVADVDEALVDKAQLTAWLALGGRRIGLGDWRPEKSGFHGRFDVEDVTELTAGEAARPSRRGRRAASAGKRGRARQSRAA